MRVVELVRGPRATDTPSLHPAGVYPCPASSPPPHSPRSARPRNHARSSVVVRVCVAHAAQRRGEQHHADGGKGRQHPQVTHLEKQGRAGGAR